MSLETPFLCPISGKRLFKEGSTLRTQDGRTYPIIENIPVLIPEYHKHFEQIKLLKESKASWYTSRQCDSYDQGPYRHHLLRRRRIVERWIQECADEFTRNHPQTKPMRVLDQGCGDGASTRWLVASVPSQTEIFATDYNLQRIKRCQDLLGLSISHYFLSDVTKGPLEEASFDLIFSNHVIEHIPDDQGFLDEIQRLLKPGGFFLLGCPNEGVFFWMLAYALSPASIRSTDHLHFYNADSLIQKGEKSKLHLIKSEHLGYGVPHWMMDGRIRQFKLFDDLLHTVGKTLFPGQASSLYLLFQRETST